MKYAIFYIILVIITLLIMSASQAETVLTLIIGAVGTISGWAAYFYQYLSDKPKIKGKILQVMRGVMRNPEQPSENLTVFTLFLYLTNTRKNAIHLKDYILEVDLGDGFEKTRIIRGSLQNFRFGYEDGEILIPNLDKKLIYKQSKPIQFGIPYYGYLLFGGDLKYYKADIKRYRITCIDVFDHKHIITVKLGPDSFVDLFYLQEVFGIKIPVARTINPNISYEEGTNLIDGNDASSNNR